MGGRDRAGLAGCKLREGRLGEEAGLRGGCGGWAPAFAGVTGFVHGRRGVKAGGWPYRSRKVALSPLP